MTIEELRELKPGQDVEIWFCGKWLRVTVTRTSTINVNAGIGKQSASFNGVYAIGEVGNIKGDMEKREWFTHVKQVRKVDTKLADSFDPLEANVYADWLEENRHEEAANKLRERFPISEQSYSND